MNKRIVIVTILAALWLALPAAAATTVITLGNGGLDVPAGETATLLVSVAEVQNLYGIEIHLRFDPAVVQVADADTSTDGVQVAAGDFLSADFVAQNLADNQAGTIDYAVTQINPSEPKSGSGTLLAIQFQGVGAGRASLVEVADQILSTLDGEIIPATVVSGQLRVGGSMTSGATAAPPSATGSPAGTPSTAATPTAPADLSAPAATRTLVNTPVPAAPAATAPLATPGQAAGAPPPAPTRQAGGTASAGEPQAPATEAPATDAPASDAPASEAPPAVGDIIAAPSPPAAEAPMSGQAPAATRSTPALVAKSQPGSSNKAILEPGALEKAGVDEQQRPSKQPAPSGILIAAGVLLGLAVVAGTMVFWLSSRRRRA